MAGSPRAIDMIERRHSDVIWQAVHARSISQNGAIQTNWRSTVSYGVLRNGGGGDGWRGDIIGMSLSFLDDECGS